VFQKRTHLAEITQQKFFTPETSGQKASLDQKPQLDPYLSANLSFLLPIAAPGENEERN